ncbi:MAG: thiamine pyrophosphate-dependent enzyme [Candidatus Dormibacteria bacterium]
MWTLESPPVNLQPKGVLRSRFNANLMYGQPPLFGEDQLVIQVDISPEQLGGQRSASLGLVGNVGATLDALTSIWQGGSAMGTLGVGLPFAIWSGLGRPDRPVCRFTGDGAFWFSLRELPAAARHGVGMVLVVVSNGVWRGLASRLGRLAGR